MTRVWASIVVAGVGLGVGPALALDTPNERITLVGLTGVHVVVYDVGGEGERAGLAPRRFQAEVEQRLRRAGLRALDAGEALKSASRPTLELRMTLVRAREAPRLYVYSVELALRQQIQLTRNRTIESFAITWSDPPEVGAAEPASLSVVREAIRGKVEQFVAAWLVANPD
jgi:hypothetical protein